MRPKRQWIKLHQRLQDHPWLNDRPEWFAAWVQILLAADNEGRVDLTDVQARDHFTPKAWRHFLDKLGSENMISHRRTVNLGRDRGMRVVAELTSWTSYQSLARVEKVGARQGAEQTTPEGQSSRPSHTAQTTPEGQSKTGGRGAARGQAYIPYKNLRNPPTPLPAAVNTQKGEGSKKTPWPEQLEFAATPIGRELITCLGPLAQRTPLDELKRLAGLWTELEVRAAWQQAKRDAKTNTNKVLLLILQGQIALDRSLLPEAKAERRAYTGPQPGQAVSLPDGSRHKVFAFDDVGNWVFFEDRDPVRPEDCTVVVRVSK